MVIDKAGSAEIDRDSGFGEVLIELPGQPAGNPTAYKRRKCCNFAVTPW